MANIPLMSSEAASAEGFVPSTNDTGPCVEEETSSTAGCKDTEEARLPCAFYMRTGTCAYGDRCKFSHPQDRPHVYMNSRGLPLRPSEPECSFYMRNGWCSFSDTCKFHHPELPDRHPAADWGPTAAGKAQQPEGSASSTSSSQQGRQKQHNTMKNNIKQQAGPTYMAHPAFVPMAPYGPMPPHGMMVPYMNSYYHPAMSPHPRMYPAVTAPMGYGPVYMRPYMSMPMAGPPMQLTQQMQQLNISGTSSRSSSSRHRSQQGHNSASGPASGSSSRATKGGSSRPAGNACGSGDSHRKAEVADDEGDTVGAAADAPAGHVSS